MPFKNPHPLYNVWRSMRDRCMNPNSPAFQNYGGRGIKICERWEDFQTFARDMGQRPKGWTMDRIDNDGDYSPSNCRWADRKTQQRNQRRAVYVTIEGKSYRAIELAEKIGVKVDTIVARAERGLPYAMVMSPKRFRDTSGFALGGKANGKRQQAKTHCPKGHEYSDENTSFTPQGWRVCKECRRQKSARERAARKAAD